VLGTKHSNSFDILNEVDDEYLVKTAKALEISLTSDDEGCKAQISAIKAEERLRANLAESTYQAHLANLKLKDRIQADEGLDLAIIDNNKRDFPSSSDSQIEKNSKKHRNHKGARKKGK
jgi:hypothetical protein